MPFEEVNIEYQDGGQVLKIPDNFRVDGTKVYLKKVGSIICVIPFHRPWGCMLESLDEFSDDFMDNRGQGQVYDREDFA